MLCTEGDTSTLYFYEHSALDVRIPTKSKRIRKVKRTMSTLEMSMPKEEREKKNSLKVIMILRSCNAQSAFVV